MPARGTEIAKRPCLKEKAQSVTRTLASLISEDSVSQARGPAHPDDSPVYCKDGRVHLDVAETNLEALKHPKRIGALDPTVTIIAYALRVADIIKDRL